MKRLLVLAPALALLVVLGGCSLFHDGAARPMLSTDKTAYSAGEAVTIRLENRTDERVGYNLCFVSLERRTENAWVGVEGGWADPEIFFCTAILRVLQSGETAALAGAFRDDLYPGTYRFTHDVEVGDRERLLVSNAFVIR